MKLNLKLMEKPFTCIKMKQKKGLPTFPTRTQLRNYVELTKFQIYEKSIEL